ncbi:DUF1801 domain-containing protein [Pseudopedobacter sp.]|uniref:DUF1801 domain-containing protein n=1 Tax=Pseudopedobacter sp. TaxID=1936787 RepID=UPI0033407584
MSTINSHIEQYIEGFDSEKKNILEKLLLIIRNVVPPETEETFSYQMPTFRYNGNLIHFAAFKNHIGLYPGPDAIQHFASELQTYKTSKGAIQIPLDKPLPQKLIESIVLYNVEKLRDKKAPRWDSYREQWVSAEEIMNQIIVQTPLKKEFKWGTDIYTFQGKNVIGWGGFKSFFSIWFYNGVFLEDKEKVLVSASEGKTKSLRQWRFTDVKKMDEKKILAYIQESIQTIIDGKALQPQKSEPAKPEGILKVALQNDKVFQSSFESLTPGRKKEYIEYINEAKQEATKQKRLEKIIPLIMQGKGLHDQYKNK